jgi:hypothetical protein
MRIDPGCAGEHLDHLLGSEGSGEHGAAPRPIAFGAGRPRSQGDVARDHGAARQYHLYDRMRATKTAELPDVLEDNSRRSPISQSSSNMAALSAASAGAHFEDQPTSS